MQKFFYRFFPCATSKDFFHYIKPTLQDPQTNFNIAVLHDCRVGVAGGRLLGAIYLPFFLSALPFLYITEILIFY